MVVLMQDDIEDTKFQVIWRHYNWDSNYAVNERGAIENALSYSWLIIKL